MGGIVLVPTSSSISFNDNLIELSISAVQNLNRSTKFIEVLNTWLHGEIVYQTKYILEKDYKLKLIKI